MNIIAFSGSLRQKSFNRGLLRTSLEVKPQGMDIEIFDLNGIPLFNQDTEDQGMPKAVTQFKQKLEAADGILISTPEYNRSFSGVIKNAIDWGTRPEVSNSFKGKPVAIMGASDGSFGTARAQVHLRSVMWAVSAYSMPKPELLATNAKQNFDISGNLTDEKTKQRLTKFLVSFSDWVKQMSS